MIRSTNNLIKKHNIKFTKSLGQNFLIDENIITKIVNLGNITKEDLVIEIGPGIGNMTVELAKKAGQVVAVEIDKHLLSALEENLKEFNNVMIINEDILKVDVNEIISRFKFKSVKVIANLPYYITTPIIMGLLEKQVNIDKMVFMIQKEVSERMVAKEGTKNYGSLTVAVNYYASPRIAFIVSPNCFVPKPEVDSAVVELVIDKVPKVDLVDKDVFRRTVRASFSQRRKTLLNALSSSMGFNISKDNYRKIFNKLGIKENQRGETLTIYQFAKLSNEICEEIQK